MYFTSMILVILIGFVALVISLDSNATITNCDAKSDPDCGRRVTVSLYYETVCPFSRDFVVQQLYPTYRQLNDSEPNILDVELVPFGNADMTWTNTTQKNKLNYTCQHGQAECDGNMIQSCAVVKYGNDLALELTNCMFNSSGWRTPSKIFPECATDLGLDVNALTSCANSLEGLSYQYLFAGQSNAFYPSAGVPYIVVNGRHSSEIQSLAESDLLGLVCDTYQQQPKPSPCLPVSN